MSNDNKKRSPFFPEQPVSVELFSERVDKVTRIIRATNQVEQEKPQFIFLTGEYGSRNRKRRIYFQQSSSTTIYSFKFIRKKHASY